MLPPHLSTKSGRKRVTGQGKEGGQETGSLQGGEGKKGGIVHINHQTKRDEESSIEIVGHRYRSDAERGKDVNVKVA